MEKHSISEKLDRYKYLMAVVLIVVILTAKTAAVLSVSPTTVATYNQFNNVLDCSYLIFTDGTNYYAKNCDTGVITYGGPNNAGSTTGTNFISVINAAISALPSSGGTIKLDNGANTLPASGQISVKGKTTIEGASKSGVVISTPSPAGAAGTYWIVNTNTVSGDEGIVLRDFTFVGGSPTTSGSSYVNYDNAIRFQGAYNSLIYNVNFTNTGFNFAPFSGATATQQQSASGLNYNNVVDSVTAKNGVGSSSFYSCNYCRVVNSMFLNWGDDAFLIGSWGRGIVFSNDYFDGSTNPRPTIGASNAQLYLANDGAVVSNTNYTAI
jgi:hypothetical protein